VLFFILVYLAGVNFLFRQSIGWTLLNLIAVACLPIGLQVLNAPQLKGASRAGWRRMGLMLLKTLPVVVLLFLFFPRMAPLWSVPMVSGQARSGISDTMTPGSISSLAQSGERAFRATFGGEAPAYRDRYWRGLILDQFDGQTWKQSQQEPYARPGRINLDAGVGTLENNEYEVLLDATNQRWAFVLEDSAAVSDNLVAVPGDLFRFRRPADTTLRYRLSLESEPSAAAEELSAADRRRFLQLPVEGNRRSRALATRMRQNSDSAGAVVDSFLDKLRTEAYFYTLRPPEMPDDGIDSLLFEEKRGFCAHYAGAMTFVLRAAGIPARVVVGYQGGSPGADDDYLIIRQYDAHAWVEAWLPGAGWVRFDPTGAIAPSRVESGLRDAVADEGSFLENDWASAQRYGDIELLQWASLKMDQLNYQWTRWVVGYQSKSQMDLMSRLPGNLSLRALGYISAGVIALALLLAGLITLAKQRRQRSAEPVQRLVGRWHRMLEARGIEVSSGDTPAQLAQRLGRLYPAARKPAQAFAAMVNNHYYKRAQETTRPNLNSMKRLLRATRQGMQGESRQSPSSK
jgi:transglutaminase-like putative cysteine protease